MLGGEGEEIHIKGTRELMETLEDLENNFSSTTKVRLTATLFY